MARKRGEYQRRKEKKEKLQAIWGIFCLLLLLFLMFWFIINDVLTIQKIRQNSLEEYTGSYSHEITRTHGKNLHYYYLISLDNGDQLLLSKSRLENDQILEENSVLTFQYTKASRERLFSPVYAALSIETSDGDVTIIHLEDSRNACVRSVWLLSGLLLFVLLLIGGILFGYYFTVIHKNRNKPIQRN